MSRSLLQEQYEQAWQEKRALERGMGDPAPEYIDAHDPEHWVCRCGGTEFTLAGCHVGLADYLHLHWRCDGCGRLIVGPHGYVMEGPHGL
jgi:hypothetical protein